MIFSKNQLKQVSLTGDSTSKLEKKHLQFLVRGNLLSDFTARLAHNVDKNNTISVLNFKIWLSLACHFSNLKAPIS